MNIMEHPAIAEPTLSNIYDALRQLTADKEQFNQTPTMSLETFCPPQSLDEIEKAHAWWPKKCAHNFSWPVAFGSALAIYTSPTNNDPLLAHLGYAAKRTVSWLKLEGRNAERPNEDRAERMRRLNRERMAQYRSADPDKRSAAAAAWDKVQELRRGKREAKAHHDAQVRMHHESMMVEVEHRAKVMADWDKDITAAEEAHRLAKEGTPGVAPPKGECD